MTMIDEDVLINALNDVADTFVVSSEAPDRIVAEAAANEPPRRSHHVPTVISQPSRGRAYLVAAALVAVIASISVPLFRSEGNPNRAVVHGGPPPFGTSAQKLPLGGLKGYSAPLAPRPGSQKGTTITASGAATTSTGATSGVTSQKIESNGSIALAVDKGHVGAAFSSLNKLATSDGGFVASTQANAGSPRPDTFSYGTIVLEVPQRNFARLVAQAQRVGRPTSVSTSSNNVTAQYVDLQAHISALVASRRQYLVIMTKATTIDGILAVQSQLDALQSQIEQLQGQLNVLSHETTYGALTITVSEVGHHAHKASPLSGFARAWHDSVKGFFAGFEWLLRLAGPALFAVLTVGGLWGLARYVRRALRRRRI
ncbi:MAG TPA: DUF4349 domain-containing protein [Acidimicrobiales bacterium]|nr:DUF4349 domain-containing protein [Acidimicrobiales bacterium]